MINFLSDISQIVYNLLLSFGVALGGPLAIREYLIRRPFSAKLEISAQEKILASNFNRVLSIELVIRNIGLSRTLPKCIRVEVYAITVVDGDIPITFIKSIDVPVTHAGLEPSGMFIDNGEAMFRTLLIPLLSDIEAVKISVTVEYDSEEYFSFREFSFATPVVQINGPTKDTEISENQVQQSHALGQ